MYSDPVGGEVLLDVCVVSAKAGARNVVSRNAREDVVAAAAVQRKRARYGAAVVPFVFEVGGRPSDESRNVYRTLGSPKLFKHSGTSAI